VRQALKEMLSDLDEPHDPEEEPGLYAPQPETVALFDEVLAELNARAAAPAGAQSR
jgi:hypothetical protein